jgi:hypothetical protein
MVSFIDWNSIRRQWVLVNAGLTVRWSCPAQTTAGKLPMLAPPEAAISATTVARNHGFKTFLLFTGKTPVAQRREPWNYVPHEKRNGCDQNVLGLSDKQ